MFLQQLQLIELIRECKVEEALRFAQERLSEAGETDSSILSELERTLALLAFEEPSKSPFSDLLNQSHRQKVSCIRLFNVNQVLCEGLINGSWRARKYS